MAEKKLLPRLISRGERPQVISIGRHPVRMADLYIRLLASSWKRLFVLIVAAYFIINLLFALAYFAIDGSIDGARPGSFPDAFFFSVQTMATIGYGKMSPHGALPNMMVSIEALVGFVFFAVITSLIFTKFSRPTSRLMFTDKAVICPYEGKPHLMIRLANERENRIVDAHIHLVILKRERTSDGHHMRRFYDLPPVRARVPLMQLTWTVMHEIDNDSPLYGMTTDSLCEAEAEIIVSLTGLDETLSQTIHARYSYIATEVAFNSMFEDMLSRGEDGRLTVDYRQFHKVRTL